jgi:lysophospholipase L1-like esterase
VTAIALGVVLVSSVALPGMAAGSERPIYEPPHDYYLALGDSIAYGFQPTKAKPGARPSDFHTGFVDAVAVALMKLSPGIRVVNYGCPGESTLTFAHGGWRCDGLGPHDPFRGPQLTAATRFLRLHGHRVSPITLTLWGSDLFPLSARGKQAQSAIAAFGARFTSLLEQLRAAAPAAEIIVTGAWDPEADRLAQTEPQYRAVDAAIRKAAAKSRARVADMFTALDGSGDYRRQKARLCRLTFFCSMADPHPTDAGYRAMAAAFLTASGYPPKP